MKPIRIVELVWTGPPAPNFVITFRRGNVERLYQPKNLQTVLRLTHTLRKMVDTQEAFVYPMAYGWKAVCWEV